MSPMQTVPSSRVAPMGCVRLPAFALQILRRRARLDPAWPLLLVADDRPAARVLECNGAAAAQGVRVGMRYSQALSLSASIRAGVVPDDVRREAATDVVARLRSLSPAVEQWQGEEGVFFLDLRGLERLIGPGAPYEERIRMALADDAWEVRVARGWTRGATLVATARHDAAVQFASPQRERAWLQRQPVDSLPLGARDRERLRLLAVVTIAQLVALPRGARTSRLDQDTRALIDLLHRRDEPPVHGAAESDQWLVRRLFEPEIVGREVLEHEVMRALEQLHNEMRRQGRWIQSVLLTIGLLDARTVRERIDVGHATRDLNFVRRLVGLRLDHRGALGDSIRHLEVEVVAVVGEQVQETLFDEVAFDGDGCQGSGGPVADRVRLDEMVAMMEARFGGGVVGRLVARSALLPEECSRLEPLARPRDLVDRDRTPDRSGVAGGAHVGSRAPVRIVRQRAVVDSLRHVAPHDSPVVEQVGGYLISTSWWDGRSVTREYRYVRCADGQVRWQYRSDGGRPCVQGWVW